MTDPEHWVPLRFRDVDSFGHVYHAEYLTLLDDLRSHWFGAALGLDDPGAYVLVRAEVDYVSPLLLADTEVRAEFAVERVGTTSLTLNETLCARDGRVVARTRVVTVRWDPARSAARPFTDEERGRAESLRAAIPE